MAIGKFIRKHDLLVSVKTLADRELNTKEESSQLQEFNNNNFLR